MKRRLARRARYGFLAISFILALASGASAQPGEFVKGILQPLADGFPKRALTIINVDDAGSRDGIYAREMQASLKDISPVPVVISDEPAPSFGTWYVLKTLAKREGGAEGYYPLMFSPWGAPTDLLVEPIEKELGIKLTDANMVTVNEYVAFMLFQRKNAPWGPTFADMVKYAKANPGKLKYLTTEVGSGTDIACEWFMRDLGFRDAITIKIPQGSHQAVAAAIGSGDGDFAMGLADVVINHWQNKKIDVTMIMGDSVPPPWDKDPNVVSSKSLGFSTPLGGMRGICVPTEVPKAHVDWLYKLFKAMTLSEKYQQRAKTIPGLVIRGLNPEESMALNKKVYESCDPVVRSLGIHVDQKK